MRLGGDPESCAFSLETKMRMRRDINKLYGQYFMTRPVPRLIERLTNRLVRDRCFLIIKISENEKFIKRKCGTFLTKSEGKGALQVHIHFFEYPLRGP